MTEEKLNPSIPCVLSNPHGTELPEHHAPHGVDDPFTMSKKPVDSANSGLLEL